MLLGLCGEFPGARSWVRLYGHYVGFRRHVHYAVALASAFNRGLISLGVGFGLSVNLVVWVTCGIELLVLCRVGKWIATRTAACMAWVLVLPVAILEAGFCACREKIILIAHRAGL